METTYTCPRCGYETSDRGNYTKHLHRKHPCKPLVNDISLSEVLKQLQDDKDKNKKYVCDSCGSKYSCPQNLCRHRKTCVGYKKDDPLIPLSEVQRIVDERVAEALRSVAPSASINTGTINNTLNNGPVNNNHGTVNNTHIHIHALGHEDTSYLSNNQRFMIQCIRDKAYGLVEYIRRKHFDTDHPENNNMKKLNRKDDFMEYYDGKKWTLRYTEDVLDIVFNRLMNEFSNFVEMTYGDGKGQLKKKHIENFMKEVGTSLAWDLSFGENTFEPDPEMSQEQKDRARDRIYRLAEESIYRATKSL